MIEFSDVAIDNDLTADEGGATWAYDGEKFKGYSVFVNGEEVIFSERELKAMLKEIKEEL